VQYDRAYIQYRKIGDSISSSRFHRCSPNPILVAARMHARGTVVNSKAARRNQSSHARRLDTSFPANRREIVRTLIAYKMLEYKNISVFFDSLERLQKSACARAVPSVSAIVHLSSRHVDIARVKALLAQKQLMLFNEQPLLGIAITRHWIYGGFSAVMFTRKSTYTAWWYVPASCGPGCQVRRMNFDVEECQETQDDRSKGNHNCDELST
jgi:hypothetical protein